MGFLIADTFTDSLAKLTGDEQKAVKTTVFNLQLNPANPGTGFHKHDKARDKNLWSVRVSSDRRIIVPKTRAAQLVEIPEMVQEIAPLRRRDWLPILCNSFKQPNIILSFGRDIGLQSAA